MNGTLRRALPGQPARIEPVLPITNQVSTLDRMIVRASAGSRGQSVARMGWAWAGLRARLRVMKDSTGTATSPIFAGRLATEAGAQPATWHLAEEVPAAVMFDGQFFAVMMVTPADLEDFAVGFTVTEGIVERADEISAVRVAEANDGYALNIKIPEARLAGIETRRRVLTGRSGCGICGAQTLDAAVAPPRHVSGRLPKPAAILRALVQFPSLQPMNQLNHSTHAAGFATLDGALQLVREDVGRHNALDKLAGALLRDGRSTRDGFVIMSSRCSMEIVQKAAILGVPLIASVSAPTALALRLARAAGMTLAAASGDGVMVFEA
jgi:FdhD protein